MTLTHGYLCGYEAGTEIHCTQFCHFAALITTVMGVPQTELTIPILTPAFEGGVVEDSTDVVEVCAP